MLVLDLARYRYPPYIESDNTYLLSACKRLTPTAEQPGGTPPPIIVILWTRNARQPNSVRLSYSVFPPLAFPLSLRLSFFSSSLLPSSYRFLFLFSLLRSSPSTSTSFSSVHYSVLYTTTDFGPDSFSDLHPTHYLRQTGSVA